MREIHFRIIGPGQWEGYRAPGVAASYVVDWPEFRFATVTPTGFGQATFPLSPGQTLVVETQGGRVVEIHRLGKTATWQRASARDPNRRRRRALTRGQRVRAGGPGRRRTRGSTSKRRRA